MAMSVQNFIHEDFLLDTDHARELYHSHAKDCPILDYHNHLPPRELAEDRRFENMSRLWIEGDHYKWRAMRALGIGEGHISGDAPDLEKFKKWAATLPYAWRNPLFHWSQLELLRYFGIDDLLGPDNAERIYAHCNEMLSSPSHSARGLIQGMNVEVLCTTDDPLDDLSGHRELSGSPWPVQVLPSFRPDGMIHIEKPGFVEYLSKLSGITGIPIVDFESLSAAMSQRVDYFHEAGCRLADHGLSHAHGGEFSPERVNAILKDRLSGGSPSPSEQHLYKSAVLFLLGRLYSAKDWCMQLHLGPIRNTNQAVVSQLGINAGVDSIGDFPQAEQLASLLNRLNDKGHLPKTVLYNSNPRDNAVFATMAGNFTGEGIKGKVQFGAAWWFLDQMDGITDQLGTLSNMGLLSCSVGMITDSRSFLSFSRHEYFRRVLCNLLGRDIKKGLLPCDMDWIGKLVGDICHRNAREFFRFPTKEPALPLRR